MTHHAFGTLMALEPGFAVYLGLLALHQHPSLVKLVGVSLVVISAVAAQRGGRGESAVA